MPVKYIPYYPDPIEGQAILDNFSRTLKYKDSYEVKNKLKRGMPFYELEKIEQVGSNKNNNMLIRGECLSACAYLKDKNIKVDLVYIDPPFASGANYAKKIYLRRNPTIAEKILEKEQELKNGKELDLEEIKRFEENMYGDIWRKEDYLNWMYENLLALMPELKRSGSFHLNEEGKILMTYADRHNENVFSTKACEDSHVAYELLSAPPETVGTVMANWLSSGYLQDLIPRIAFRDESQSAAAGKNQPCYLAYSDGDSISITKYNSYGEAKTAMDQAYQNWPCDADKTDAALSYLAGNSAAIQADLRYMWEIIECPEKPEACILICADGGDIEYTVYPSYSEAYAKMKIVYEALLDSADEDLSYIDSDSAYICGDDSSVWAIV